MLGLKIVSTIILALFSLCLFVQAHNEDAGFYDLLSIIGGLVIIAVTIWL